VAEAAGLPRYEIRVRGRLGASWAAWFDGLEITSEPGGTSLICGPVVDQAALHGLIQRLRDLGLPLESLTRLDPAGPSDPDLPADPSPHTTNHTPSGGTT
jgi:hypothetical protein